VCEKTRNKVIRAKECKSKGVGKPGPSLLRLVLVMQVRVMNFDLELDAPILFAQAFQKSRAPPCASDKPVTDATIFSSFGSELVSHFIGLLLEGTTAGREACPFFTVSCAIHSAPNTCHGSIGVDPKVRDLVIVTTNVPSITCVFDKLQKIARRKKDWCVDLHVHHVR